MIKWTGLAPWEFEFPFPSSLTSTFLGLFPTSVQSERLLLLTMPGLGMGAQVPALTPERPVLIPFFCFITLEPKVE